MQVRLYISTSLALLLIQNRLDLACLHVVEETLLPTLAHSSMAAMGTTLIVAESIYHFKWLTPPPFANGPVFPEHTSDPTRDIVRVSKTYLNSRADSLH